MSIILGGGGAVSYPEGTNLDELSDELATEVESNE